MSSVKQAYEQGQRDYGRGLVWWENPYAAPTNRIDAFQGWLAGWTYAKQKDEERKSNE